MPLERPGTGFCATIGARRLGGSNWRSRALQGPRLTATVGARQDGQRVVAGHDQWGSAILQTRDTPHASHRGSSHDIGGARMTPSPRSVSPEAGVTDAAAEPQAMAGPLRFLPPTAAEVGRAAALCFQDTHSDEQIARQLGIVRRTLARWKRRSEFAAAFAALQAWQEIQGEASGADASSSCTVGDP